MSLQINKFPQPGFHPNACPLSPTPTHPVTHSHLHHPPHPLFCHPPSHMPSLPLSTCPPITLPHAHVNAPPCSQFHLPTFSLPTFLPIYPPILYYPPFHVPTYLPTHLLLSPPLPFLLPICHPFLLISTHQHSLSIHPLIHHSLFTIPSLYLSILHVHPYT